MVSYFVVSFKMKQIYAFLLIQSTDNSNEKIDEIYLFFA